MNSYDELSPGDREQLEAFIANLKNNVFLGMLQYQEDYLREHAANLVQTCLSIDRSTRRSRRLARR